MAGGEIVEHRGGDRCIVWHPRGVAPDAELLGALARRGLSVVCCDNRCEALARVCVLGSRRSLEEGKTILLLSDPDRLAGPAEVVALAERYASRAICGTFEVAERKVRAVTPEDTERWARSAKPALSPIVTLARHMAARASGTARVADGSTSAASLAAAISGPRLRLTGEGQLPPAAPGSDEEDEPGLLKGAVRSGSSENAADDAAKGPEEPTALITDQELAMLLAKDPLPEQD